MEDINRRNIYYCLGLGRMNIDDYGKQSSTVKQNIENIKM